VNTKKYHIIYNENIIIKSVTYHPAYNELDQPGISH